MILFLVTVAGGAGTWFLLVRPLSRVVRAARWPAVDCRIVSSSVGTHSDSDGTTYSIDIVYEYSVDGRAYRSERYDFFLEASSSGYASKEAVVERYPAGSTAVCYVDPGDPSDAVLDRSFRPVYLLGLFPLVFFLVFGAVFVGVLHGSRLGKDRDEQPRLPSIHDPGHVSASVGAQDLQSTGTPLSKFIGISLASLFWNGFVWGVGWFIWRQGELKGCIIVFLGVFALIGALLLISVPYQFLALWNPRPRLTLRPAPLSLEGTSELEWRFAGLAGRISKLTVSLIGQEWCRYRRGTSTSTDTEVFMTLKLVESESPLWIREGRCTVSLPSGSMHSFKADNNRIEWKLQVRGEIRFWPDVIEDFEMVVEP